MTSTERFVPATRRVVVAMAPGGSPLSVVGPLEAFDVANRFLASRGRPALYDVRLAAPTVRVPSSVGVALEAVPLADVSEVHTLVVGGGPELAPGPFDPALLREVARLSAVAERTISVCSGAFALGELGLLDGRRCTTHWLWLEALRRRFPAARVEEDAIYTEDGPIWTSAGVTAGIDLALQLVRTDGGSRLAHAVARALVVFAHRPGGQTQFGSALRLRPGLDDRLRDLVAGLIARPGDPLDVEVLARRVGMSPRNFSRVFKAQAGETPAAFVAKVRVEAAQRALADGDASILQIALDCGFGTEATFRRTFRRVVGVSPSDWRDRFPRARSEGGGAG